MIPWVEVRMWAWGDWLLDYGPAGPTLAGTLGRVIRQGPDGAVIHAAPPPVVASADIDATERAVCALGLKGAVGERMHAALLLRYLRAREINDAARAKLHGSTRSTYRRVLDDAHWWLAGRLSMQLEDCSRCERLCVVERRRGSQHLA